MNFLIIFIVGLSLLISVTCFNKYSLYNNYYGSNIPNLSYKSVPIPLSPRLFFFNNGNNGLFQNFLQFPLVQSCSSIRNTNNEGSCLNLVTCLAYQGKPSGFCQGGFKTCCLPIGSSSRLPVSTFLGSSSSLLPATFRIRRTNSNFCQVRLDFRIFNVGAVDTNGNCVGGLTITGHSSTNNLPFIICGSHTGQSTFLNFNNDIPITLLIDASGQGTGSWNIRATQIRCSDQVITTTTTTTTSTPTPTSTTPPTSTTSPLPVSTFTGTASTRRPVVFPITIVDSSYCQVRLDFDTFNVSNVNQQGFCDEGGLVISGHSNTNNVPDILCGLNTGQHIYLNLNNANPIMMTVNDSGMQLGNWNIRATQIKCSDPVPQNCLQYFNESTGVVSSFNFRNIPSVNQSQPTYMMSNLNYSVCLGSDPNNFREIIWMRPLGATPYYFVVSNIASAVTSTEAGTIFSSVSGPRCGAEVQSLPDYVEIRNGSFFDFNNNLATASLFCGLGFPTTVTSNAKPFRLRVVTNGVETAAGDVLEGSIGFSLLFQLL